jgi:hypothetical protein
MSAVLDVFGMRGGWINRPACRTPEGSRTGVLLSRGFVVSLWLTRSVLVPPLPFVRAEGALVDDKQNRGLRAPICRAGTRNLSVLVACCGCFSGRYVLVVSLCVCGGVVALLYYYSSPGEFGGSVNYVCIYGGSECFVYHYDSVS